MTNKTMRDYINIIERLQQDVMEAPVDSKFAGFMNQTLGQKVDEPAENPTVPDFIAAAPVFQLDSMGYQAALDFGIKTLNKLTPTQKTKLATRGEDGVLVWLETQAKKQGFLMDGSEDEDDESTQHMFMSEDLDEVQSYLEDVFKDPSITSWALVLTDGEPLPKKPSKGPFTISINPGLEGKNAFSGDDWKKLHTVDNLPAAKTLAQELANKNPKQFIKIQDAGENSVGWYTPGKGWQ